MYLKYTFHTKMLIFVLMSFIFQNIHAKYQYLPQVAMAGNYIIYQSGSTQFADLVAQCDAMGIQCAGFDTVGNMYNTINKPTSNMAVGTFMKIPGAAPAPLPVLWPLPQQYTFGQQTIVVSTPFSFQPNIQSPILNKGIARYTDLIFTHMQQNDTKNNNKVRQNSINAISILVASDNDTLQLGIDESYSLSVSLNSAVVLKAATIYGALRGLETFSQLVNYNFDNADYEILNGPISINDYPQFEHRGVLIDVSRHFITVKEIKRVIDGISYAKLNVLHIHISDAQSFPLESKTYPDLWAGSYSKRERYTQAEMSDLVQYAKERGVRVIPEFDGPGHMYAWGIGYPDILPDGYADSPNCLNVCPNNPCDVPLDPVNPLTYTILDSFMGEITGGAKREGIFTDDFMHLGGDEVETGCWNNSAEIQQYMKENNVTLDDLYMLFVQKFHNIATSYGRTPINWEEVFNHFGTKLPIDTIIHVWLDHATLANVVNSGYRGILSNQDDWYLDHLNTDWTVFYLNDPYEGISEANQHLVIGGETCMWGETVDISDQLVRIFPKAAIVAERLWTYSTANQNWGIENAIPRIQDFRCRLSERGVPTAPLYSPFPEQPGSCYNL